MSGAWQLPIFQLGSDRINNIAEYRSLCTSKGFPNAGKGFTSATGEFTDLDVAEYPSSSDRCFS
jgi:hypothetical protein